jgi:hypothetical protein
MKLAASLSAAITILVLPVLTTGCGVAGAPASIGRQSPAHIEAKSSAPAVPPGGTAARDVSYRCHDGREGTMVVNIPDLDRLADQLNRIQPCEYDHGLSRASLTVMCRSRPLVVHVTAADGHVEQPSKTALCLQ